MIYLALGILILWLPIVLVIFEKFPVQQAIVLSFVSAWLFLPPIVIPLPGIPDWSKSTATVASVTLAVALKRGPMALLPRLGWYDLPVLIFSSCSLVSSISMGMGVYEGLSSTLNEMFWWGLPYLIGRTCLGNEAGVRQICLGLAAGGIAYILPCIAEIRLSPILKQLVYGLGGTGMGDFGLRYGGYRPAVFLASGLELGWWMCCSSLCAYMLWASGSVKRVFGLPMPVMTSLLAMVTVACKSTGALVQIGLGLLLIQSCRWSKSTLLIWGLMLIGPIYCTARPAGLLSGDAIVSYTNMIFDEDRMQSLHYRFIMEEVLMRAGNQRPIFGWSRNGGYNPIDKNGQQAAITDGFWIIVFCNTGNVGLLSMNLMLLIPTALFLKRHHPRTWSEPEVAPQVAIAFILPLYLIDNLSNAMLNPIYAICMGSLTGCSIGRNRGQASSGRGAAGQAASGAMGGISPGDDAVWLEAEAITAEGGGRIEEASELFRRAIRAQMRIVQSQPLPEQVDLLARYRSRYGRFLAATDQPEFAIIERDRADGLWRSIDVDGATGTEPGRAWAANANDLAWLLAIDPGSDPARLDRAGLLVEEAMRAGTDDAPFWNTLGLVHHRRAEHLRAIHALSRSVNLSGDGGTAFDFYLLALANQALGYERPAGDWFLRGEAWGDLHPEAAPALGSIQAEARDALLPRAVNE